MGVVVARLDHVIFLINGPGRVSLFNPDSIKILENFSIQSLISNYLGFLELIINFQIKIKLDDQQGNLFIKWGQTCKTIKISGREWLYPDSSKTLLKPPLQRRKILTEFLKYHPYLAIKSLFRNKECPS